MVPLGIRNLGRLGQVIKICVLLSGIAALIAVASATVNGEWRPHFFHLLYRTWQEFKEAEGSSTTGIISNAVYPFIIAAITLFFIWQGRGWRAVMEHWEREIWTVVKVAVIVTLLLYGPVFIWQFVKTNYASHMLLVQTISNKTIEVKQKQAEIDRLTHSSVTAQISAVSIASSESARNNTFVVLMVEEQNRLGPPTSLDHWDAELQTPSGTIHAEVPLIPSTDVHMGLAGRPGTITITPAHYCPIATSTPLTTGEARECWIWALFRGVLPDSLYENHDTLGVTFRDIATNTDHKIYRKVDFPKELHLPGEILGGPKTRQ